MSRRWVERSWIPVFLVFLAIPVQRLLADPPRPVAVGLILAGIVVFVALYVRVMLAAVRTPGANSRPAELAGLCALSAALLVVLRQNWLLPVSYYLTGCLVLSLPARRVIPALAALAGAELLAAWLLRLPAQDTLWAVASAVLFAVGMLMVRLLLVTVEQLRHARAELARLAVVDERLRFARDLHDLLGHGLSAIAVKSELAGRLIGRDPRRAACEISDVEHLAREALTDIRDVVSGYRGPALREEVDGAQQILAAAGISCTVSVAETMLPAPVEEQLAWVMREAVTNVVRHARASRCQIKLSTCDGCALLEVVDDGIGPGNSAAGHGLSGLAERMATAGGTLDTGPATGRGFRLHARVPIGPQA